MIEKNPENIERHGGNPDRACPHCNAPSQQVGANCTECNKTVSTVLPTYAETVHIVKILSREWFYKMTPLRWILFTFLLFITGVYIWQTQIIPNPVILLAKHPTTELSSMSKFGEWSMASSNMQRTRHVKEFNQQPSGKLLWSTEEGFLSGISLPSIVDNTVFVGSSFKFFFLDASTGEIKLERDMGGHINSSPAISESLVYFGSTDTHVYAIDRFTGETHWRFKAKSLTSGAPLVSNGMVFIGSGDEHMYGLDAATGKLLWKYFAGMHISSSPSLENGVLYFTTANGLFSVNYRTGQSRMHFRTYNIDNYEPPVLANGLVYMDKSGTLQITKAGLREWPGRHRFETIWRILWVHRWSLPKPPAQSGTLWRLYPDNKKAWISSVPAVTETGLYVGDSDGKFYARHPVDASEIWTFQAKGEIRSSPIIVGSNVYFGTTDGIVYSLDTRTGERLWELNLGSPIKLPPSFAEDKLFFRTEDGKLHAIH
ncbi:hypothetical protein FIM04_04990 [SAR202 cluster bacterium AC-409-J13_OGT_754m]|nr:hypothetical protein [SAR202 cluster bacterium AC-409-J13_OGT_754m]